NPAQALLWFAHAAQQARQDPIRRGLNLARVRGWSPRVPLIPTRALPHSAVLFRQVEFHPGGRWLLTVSAHDEAVLGDLPAEKRVALPGGSHLVGTAVWSPDGGRLAVGTTSNEVEIFSFPEGRRLQRIRHAGRIRALAFSPDGQRLALASH